MKPRTKKNGAVFKIVNRLRYVRTKDGHVMDQYGRIFTEIGGRFVGCGYATH